MIEPEQFEHLLTDGAIQNRIQIIKAVRDKTGLGVRDAKTIVDAWFLFGLIGGTLRTCPTCSGSGKVKKEVREDDRI